MRRGILFLVLCGLLAAAPASAQIAFDASSAATLDSTSFTHTATGDHLVLVVGCFDDMGASNRMTAINWNPPGGQEAFAKIAEVKSPSDRWASLWALFLPTAGTYPITLTTTADHFWCAAESLTGVGALDVSGTGTATAATSVHTSITVAANDWIVSFVRDNTGMSTIVWTNATDRQNPSFSGVHLSDSNGPKTGAQTTTATVVSGQNFGMVSASFTPFSAGGGGGGGGTTPPIIGGGVF